MSRQCPLGCTCGRHNRPDITASRTGKPLSQETRLRISSGQSARWREERSQRPFWRSYVDGRRHFVYYLLDPNTNEVRWVGSSENPWKRLLNHCTVPTTNIDHWNWIVDLRPNKPVLRVKCIVWNREEAERIEAHLTRRLPNLLNLLVAQNKFLYHLRKGSV